jgi:hypothetical protein
VNVIQASAILFYNRHKKGIAISDQMSSCLIVPRRTIRWHHKVAFEAVAYPGILFGGVSTNSVEDRENGDLGAVAP